MFGMINLFKPPGITSRDAVTKVSRILGERQIGHAGTLDPLADGVLLLAVGRATKLVPFMQELPKRYVATFRLGLASNTQDISGECSQVTCPEVTLVDLEQTAARFVGRIGQTPPVFSAVRVNGRRAYKLARKGHQAEIAPRQIQVDSIRVIHFSFPDWTIEVICGKGTYVRTLGHDIGIALGTSATMTSLRRTAIGTFQVESAKTLEELRSDRERVSLQNPVELFVDWDRIDLTADQVSQMEFGIHPEIKGEPERLIAVNSTGELCGVLARTPDSRYRFVVNFVGRG